MKNTESGFWIWNGFNKFLPRVKNVPTGISIWEEIWWFITSPFRKNPFRNRR